MLSTFRDNFWLADADTRGHFAALLEFVEIWERWLARSIPHEVVKALGHQEEKLHAFYEHIEKKHNELRNRLRTGKA